MRSLTILATFLLAVFLTCAAQNPGGSYEKTCKNIKVHGDTLTAKCQSTGGGWHDSKLDNFPACISDIANINGKLQCKQGAPHGSYSQTCKDVHVSGSTLHAKCKDRSGHSRDASLHGWAGCRDVENDNGTLRCIP